MKTAVDVMTKHVVDIQPDATVGDAIEKMKEMYSRLLDLH